MLKGFFYVGGVGISRFVLIAFGAIIANKLGGERYTAYVLFLTFSNIVTNFSLLGVIPRILSLQIHSSKHALFELLIGATANLILALIVVVFSSFYPSDLLGISYNVTNHLILYSIIFYCIGYTYVSIVSAVFNRDNNHHSAGILWTISSVTAFVLGLISIFFNKEESVILLFSLGWFLSGLLGMLIIFILHFKSFYFSDFLLSARKLPGTMLKSVYSSLFGLPFLVIFYLLGKNIDSLEGVIGKPAFFLGFQFFSIAVFLPGVLGGIFVPKLSKSVGIDRTIYVRKLSLIYTAIGISWLIGVWIMLPFLFDYYGISHTPDSSNAVLLWQVAGVVAAVGAIQNQFLVACGRFTFLLLGGLLWAFVAVSIPNVIHNKLLGPVTGILTAYLILQIFYWLGNKYCYEK